jgi:hypothetical protein
MPTACRVRISHAIVGACAFASVWSTLAQPVTAPWRRNDATLISVFFDSVGKEAPASLRAAEVTDNSASSVTLLLIGHTTTGRPTYQGELAHPLRIGLPSDLPGGSVGRFDRPAKLENSIEGWVYSTSALQCVSGEKFPIAQSVVNGAAIPGANCPDVGAVVSYRIDNSPPEFDTKLPFLAISAIGVVVDQ